MIGTAREHVARLERMDRADPFDAARDIVRHVAGVVVLHQRAVDPQPYLKIVRVLHFVGGHEKRSHGPKSVARLHLIERVAGRRQAARGTVDKIYVAENIFHRLRGGDIGGALADNERQFRLAFENRRGHVGQHHRVVVADHAVWRLVKSVDRRRLLARAVLHVVHRHAVYVDRPRQRRPNPHASKWRTLAVGGPFLQRAAVIAEALDQSADEIVRPGVRDLTHHRRHIHHSVALQHAKLEIIEE